MNNTINNAFITAINPNDTTRYRIIAEQSNGDIGITRWFTKLILDDMKADIVNAGHTILEIETKQETK